MENPKELLAEARAIIGALRLGALSYSQAKTKVVPLLWEINKRGREIAKKHRVRYRQITFTSLVR